MKILFYHRGEFDSVKRHSFRRAVVNATQSKTHCWQREGESTIRVLMQRLIFLSLLLLSINTLAGADADRKYDLDIQRQSVAKALTQLSEQADVQVFFPYNLTKGKTANAVKGNFTVLQAADLMLKGSGLHGGISKKGVLTIFEGELKGGGISRGEQSMQYRKNLLAATVAFFSGVGGAQVGLAQEGAPAQESEGWMLEEIVVTATKRSTSLQDTAMSVSALSSDTIDKRNLVGMADYLNTLPGVSILDQGPGFNSVVIRGLSADPQEEGRSSGPVTGVYFGETAISGFGISGNSADIKLVDMERVEVLRGPQGTLYGAGAMGGVVRNIPAAPDLSQFEGNVQAGYSSTAEEGGDNTVIKGVINIPVVEDSLAIRAVAYRYDNSGYYKNTAASDPVTAASAATYSATAKDEDDVGSNEFVGGRISTLWRPVDELSINLSYLNQDIDQDGWGQADLELAGGYSQRRLGVRTDTTAPDFGGADNPEGYSDDIEITNLSVEYDLGWASIFSSTSWVDEESEVNRDLTAFFGGYPWSNPVIYTTELFSEEVRLASNLDGAFQFIVGLYYEERDSSFENFGLFGGNDISLSAFPAFGIPAGEALFIDAKNEGELTQKAFFGELSYEVTEEVKLTVGGRAFSYEREASSQNFDALVVPASPVVKTDSDEDDVSLKAGVEYTPNEDALFYATWSEGFRLGYPVPASSLPASLCDPDGDGIFDGSNGISTGPRQIDSDFVENFEIGSKLSFLDSRLTVNTALYQIDWDGIPIRAQFDFCGAVANAGEAQSRGVELEMAYHLSEQVLLNFSTSYIDAELTEDAEAIGAEKGDRLPGSARYNASVGVEYNFVVNSYDAYIRSDYAYVGGFYNNLQETGTEIGDYGKLNIKAGVTLDQFDIDLYMDNVTNDDAITWVDSEGFPNQRGNRLRPRTVGLNVGYRF